MSSQVKLTWNKAKMLSVEQGVYRGLARMAADIASQARSNAPYDTGALRNSIRWTDEGQGNFYVIAGGSVGGKRIDYARLREYENNKNPQTKHYMKRAFDNVTTGSWQQKYFGGITK